MKSRTIIIGLIIIANAIGLFFFIRDWREKAEIRAHLIPLKEEIRQEVERIKGEGHPVTWQDLQDRHRVPEGVEDRTEIWLKAMKPFIDNLKIGKTDPIPPGEQEFPRWIFHQLDRAYSPAEPLKRQAEIKLILEASPSLKLLHQAGEREGGALFPLDFSQGMAMLFPHLEGQRQAALILSLDAAVRASEGDAPGAYRALRSGFRLSQVFLHETTMLATLVRMTIHLILIDQVENLLPHTPFSNAKLRKLRSFLTRYDSIEDLKRSLITERVIGLEAYHSPLGRKLNEDDRFEWEAVITDDTFSCLRSIRVIIGLLDDPHAKVKQAIADLKKKEKAFLDQGKTYPKSPLFKEWSLASRLIDGNHMGLILLPTADSAHSRAVFTLAHQRLADTGIALELFRRDKGRIPRALNELLPKYISAIPRDPFSGEDIQYRRLENGFLLYSIGMDGVDDGGRGMDTEDQDKDDLSFRIEYPSRDK